MIVVPAPAAKTQTRWDVTNDVHLNTGKGVAQTINRRKIKCACKKYFDWSKCVRLYLFALVLAGLEDAHEPLQLVAWISGVHQQPEIFSGAEVHVQGDNPEARLDLHGVEASVPGQNECWLQSGRWKPSLAAM